MSAGAGGVRVEAADIEVVLPLRSAVLRAGLPLDLARYEVDRHPDTVHLAAFDDTGAVVGCSTWSPDSWDGAPAWRLRGMATLPAVRGQGVGSRLLEAGMALGVAHGAAVVYCSARTSALGFYGRYGFVAVGDEYEIEHAGPHYRMWRPLP